MKFLNLNRNLQNLDNSTASKKRLFIIFGTIIFILFLIILPAVGSYFAAKNLAKHAKAASVSFNNQNLEEVKSSLDKMESSADNLNLYLNFFVWLRVIPFIGSYYSDLKHFSSAFTTELGVANQLTEILLPYKNELGFTGQPTPGQDKIAQVVKILEKLIPKLDKVAPELQKASKEVENIDVNKYPETFRGLNIRSNVETARNFITGAYFVVTQAKDAIEVAPSALGEPNPKNYMIIFQNDKEIRPTGGFMTAYAFLNLDKGRINSSSSDDIYRLDEKLLKVCLRKICPLTPPQPLVKYLPEEDGTPRSAWSMRDSNMSPDVPTSMKEFERMYGLLGEGLPFDGIILIDTHVVEELIKITGPVEVFGVKYSGEKDNRCNCPNVIFELENYAQIVEKGEADRKAILGTLMQQILAKSLGAATTKTPEFINSGVKLANSKHIVFYMHDGATQKALSKLNWTGEIKKESTNYLHINDSNFAGGKSNLYVTQEVNLSIDTKSGKHKLTINYKNPEKYGTWLNGINRDYVRIYVPRGSKLISSKGSEEEVTTKEDEILNKTYFEAFIQVRPENFVNLTFEYEIPTSLENKLLIQKQPGTKDFKYNIKVDGQIKESFELSADKEIRL